MSEKQVCSTVLKSLRKWRSTTLLLTTSLISASIAGIFQIAGMSSRTIFITSMIALVPNGSLLRHCVRHFANWVQLTDKLADVHRANLAAGLIDCLFGTAPELIFSMVALALEQVSVVQTALMGSILSNTLLILGTCFIAAAWDRDVDHLPQKLMQTNSRLLLIALGSLVTVTLFVTYYQGEGQKEDLLPDASIPALSRVAAIVLLVLYTCYWWFFFGTHIDHEPKDIMAAVVFPSCVLSSAAAPHDITVSLSKQLAERRRERARNRPAKLHPIVALLLGVGTAGMTIWLTIQALRHIHAVKQGGHIPSTFVELMILPTATTTVEGFIALLHARRREMDWAMQATIVSSIGMTLFVMPITVCAGWGQGLDSMTLHFNGFQVALVFLTVLVVTSIVQGPNGRWVEGTMLVAFYVVLGAAAWLVPENLSEKQGFGAVRSATAR